MARPGGARPLPVTSRSAGARFSTGGQSTASRSSVNTSPTETPTEASTRPPTAPASQTPSVTGGSVSSRYSGSTARGRDYYPIGPSEAPLKPSQVVPSATYIERGQRWMEKEEAYSLRDAMEELDMRGAAAKQPDEAPDEETRVYDAALDEAAELVWQHQHPTKEPHPDAPYRYKPHLRKNSYAHARTASSGKYGGGIAASGLARDSGARSVSGSSSGSDDLSRRSRPSMDSVATRDSQYRPQKPYGSVGSRPMDARRRSSMKRNISGEVERPFSGDQIWEEQESATDDGSTHRKEAAVTKERNPLAGIPLQSNQEPVGAPNKSLDKVEIHRNPPTQSRNAQYLVNNDSPAEDEEVPTPKKDGLEIRSDDIRNATSMRLKDRSPRLPEPTAVSSSPGRPIVSFDANWTPPDESTDVSLDQREASSGPRELHSRSKPQPPVMDIPSISVAEVDSAQPRSTAGQSVPSISIGADDASPSGSFNVPTITIGDELSGNTDIPVIVTPEDNNGRGKAPRALPTPGAKNVRAQRPRSHWSPAPGSASRKTTLCHECGLPIEGRFVGLAGSTERFHPRCLACYTCGMSLEAMEISPEPQQVREQRLDRIHRRAAGEVLEEMPGMTMAEDGDDRLRLFCHLDWHEHFAPRCKHCTTPILGEHIVALGQHWHYGHFFCAECGDPFEQGMTHIEKDGYAWCIKCQTQRTERRAPKCAKCRTAVVGQYIQALGGEWHEHCFRCAECQGGFDDGQIFPKEVPGGTIVLCTACRTRELKR